MYLHSCPADPQCSYRAMCICLITNHPFSNSSPPTPISLFIFLLSFLPLYLLFNCSVKEDPGGGLARKKAQDKLKAEANAAAAARKLGSTPGTAAAVTGGGATVSLPPSSSRPRQQMAQPGMRTPKTGPRTTR